MRTIDYVLKTISTIHGNLLGIGISDPQILKTIQQNDSITTCNLLEDIDLSSNGKKQNKQKKMKLHQLRKIFGKKTVDYLIVDEKMIQEQDKNFISDSIYITKGKIFYITSEKEKVMKKYKRYSVSLEEIECEDKFLLKIEVGRTKTHKIKETIYRVLDFFEYILDMITDLLLN